MKTIAIIDCSVDQPSLACYNRLLQLGVPVSYHSANKFGMSTLENLDHFYGAFIFGSASNVEDNEPWHKTLGDWALKALNQNFPIMGICFGHQLMCHLLGGEVIKNLEVNPDQKGTRELIFDQDFGDIENGEALEFVVYHTYRVINLPNTFTQVAHSDLFPNDIVRHKELPFVGIQPHPEASDWFISDDIAESPELYTKAPKTKIDGIRFILNFIKEYCIKDFQSEISGQPSQFLQ